MHPSRAACILCTQLPWCIACKWDLRCPPRLAPRGVGFCRLVFLAFAGGAKLRLPSPTSRHCLPAPSCDTSACAKRLEFCSRWWLVKQQDDHPCTCVYHNRGSRCSRWLTSLDFLHYRRVDSTVTILICSSRERMPSPPARASSALDDDCTSFSMGTPALRVFALARYSRRIRHAWQSQCRRLP